jgi:hypothetical protein
MRSARDTAIENAFDHELAVITEMPCELSWRLSERSKLGMT